MALAYGAGGIGGLGMVMEKVAQGSADHASGQGDEALLERLSAEHRALEARLAELEAHLSLTPDEQFERAQIKKMKLAKKDQILSLGRRVRPS